MSWFSRCSWCGGPFNGGNCRHCTNVSFRDEPVYDSNPNSYNQTPDFSNPPPYHNYEIDSRSDTGAAFQAEFAKFQQNFERFMALLQPENSLSMGYEHLSITPEIESDEVTNSNAENLLPIPSEYEVALEDKKEYNFSPEFETFCDYTEETRSGNTTHANYSLHENDSFCFEIKPGQESFEDNPSISRPPPEPTNDNFDLEPEVISAVMEDIDEPDEHFNPGGEIFISTNNEDVDYFPFMFVIQTFLPYLILPEISPLFLSTESEDTIFDLGLSPED
nr:hypothetical protein [Tanacetum cinerariifolium]